MSEEIKGALRYDEGKPDPLNLHPEVLTVIGRQAGMSQSTANMISWFFYKTHLSGATADDFPDADPVLQQGAKKYGSLNYTKGMLYSRVMRSFLRHIISMARGEQMCSDFGLPHRCHAMCNVVFARTYHILGYDGGKWDDREQFKLPTIGED